MKTYIELDGNDYTLGPNLFSDSQHEEKEIKEYLKEIIALLKRIAPPERVKAPSNRSKLPGAPAIVIQLYNVNFKDTNAVMKLKPTKALMQRLMTCVSMVFKSTEEWQKFFDLIKESPFLMGKVGYPNPFKLRLEWIIKPENLAKILEGVYHGR